MTAIANVSPVGMKAVPVEKRIGKTTVTLQHGDLTALPVESFVFYAKESLELGSGYGTAIQMRGGVAIRKELQQIGSIKMSEAVVTGAGELKAKYIIHACGPKFQEADLEQKLSLCMKNALEAAKAKGIKEIAFPPMGAGFYGVALDLSARVMLEAIKAHCEGETSIERIVICVVDYRDYAPFAERMKSLD